MLVSLCGALLGQHGAEVLKRHLGLSDSRIAELRTSGILHSENK